MEIAAEPGSRGAADTAPRVSIANAQLVARDGNWDAICKVRPRVQSPRAHGGRGDRWVRVGCARRACSFRHDRHHSGLHRLLGLWTVLRGGVRVADGGLRKGLAQRAGLLLSSATLALVVIGISDLAFQKGRLKPPSYKRLPEVLGAPAV